MQVTTGIILTSRQIRQLASLAKQSLPNESCAFLLGKGENEVMVTDILPMRNADESMVSFSIEPKELLQAYELAEKKKMQIVGIFHSHPARPAPSSTDTKFMEINPVVWLIYSTTNEQFKAYVYDDSVMEVAVKITE
jgi:[CysO sulfur-carrier protein]-S-L-cysteine hydrolase